MFKLICRVFDILQGPWLFQRAWHLLTRVSSLTQEETEAASQVLGPNTVRYRSVRVAEGRILRLFFKKNGDRAFTLFHTINLPASGHHSRGNLDLLVHEMVHVCQFENVGSVYIPDALRAQQTGGYKYGCWEQLAKDRQEGKRFSGYNREQQGQIAQDYYDDVLQPGLPADSPVRLAFQPFIDDLRAKELYLDFCQEPLDRT